jgi:FkbM family methyltransferase
MIASSAKKAGIAIVLAAASIWGANALWRGKTREAAGHYLKGHAGSCTLLQSLASADLSRQSAEVAGLTRRSRVAESDPRGFALWQTPLGAYWIPAGSQEALFWDLGEQQRDIYGSGLTGIHHGDVVLDCGANVGVYTRKALDSGAALVVAIEPGPENVECLRRTFAREIAARRVLLYPKGVWDRDDTLTLHTDPKNSARDSFVEKVGEGTSVLVPLTTIDSLVAELKLPKVDYIKMDIEGAERKAIAGARETIARYRPRMALCIYHLKDDPVVVPQLVHQAFAGYRTRVGCACAPDRVQPEVELFYR